MIKKIQGLDHNKFMASYTRQMSRSRQNNSDQEVIIAGAVKLYFEHRKNIAYLNQAMQYARATNGIRVNAVKAFLSHFTGARNVKGNFVKAGKDNEVSKEFNELNSWLEWADKEAKEPEYDHKAFVTSIDKYLSAKHKQAVENNDDDAAKLLEGMIKVAASAS